MFGGSYDDDSEPGAIIGRPTAFPRPGDADSSAVKLRGTCGAVTHRDALSCASRRNTGRRDRGVAKVVAWDMDGTLLDSAVVVPAAFAAALQTLGYPPATAAEVIAAYPLGPPDVIMAHLAGRPLTATDMEAYYAELEHARVQPYPGVTVTLDALRASGRPVAIFTGASRRAAEMLLAAAGLGADVLVGGDEVPRAKPAPDGLLVVAAALGVAPGDLAYIGDSPGDVRAARAAGSHAAAAAWGHMFDPAEPADSVLARPADALALLA